MLPIYPMAPALSPPAMRCLVIAEALLLAVTGLFSRWMIGPGLTTLLATYLIASIVCFTIEASWRYRAKARSWPFVTRRAWITARAWSYRTVWTASLASVLYCCASLAALGMQYWGPAIAGAVGSTLGMLMRSRKQPAAGFGGGRLTD